MCVKQYSFTNILHDLRTHWACDFAHSSISIISVENYLSMMNLDRDVLFVNDFVFLIDKSYAAEIYFLIYFL